MHRRLITTMTALTAVALLLFGAGQALAGGTDEGTPISNTASVDYTVGGVPQSHNSNTATFTVDYKIDPVVTKQGDANVVPSGTGYALSFLVTNSSNTAAGNTLQLKLTTLEGTNTFHMTTPVKIYEDANGNGTFDSGTDTDITGSPYISLAKDASATIFIVADAPSNATNGQTDKYNLVATAWSGGSTGAKLQPATSNTSGADIVFADAAGTATGTADNGQDSDLGTFTVQTASLTITKTVAVVAPNTYAIPGAVMKYTIDISNAALAQTASGVNVIDQIPADTAFYVNTAPTGGTAYAYTTDATVNSSSNWTYSPTADSNGVDTKVTGIKVTTNDIAASGSDTVTFNVKIQ